MAISKKYLISNLIILLFFLICFGFAIEADAATYYWYGGTGNWSDYTNHWSTNSGNSPASPALNAPLSTDNVVFDANSGAGTATIDPASITVASFNASASSIAINDGGHSVTVNGNILISSTASRLTSTGTWTQGASGNLSNPTSGNFFKNLVIAGSGVTTTMTGNVWVGLTGGGTLTLGPGTLSGVAQTLYFYANSNDALTVNNLSAGSVLGSLYFTIQSTVTQKAITLPNNFGNVNINLNVGTPRNLTATGNFNFGNNYVGLINSMVTGVPTNYLNMDIFALTCGSLNIGSAATNSYLKLGSNISHSVGAIARSGTGVSNILDMGSSTIASSGNVNLTALNVTPGTSTLVMTGASSQLTAGSQTLNNLTYNSSGGTLTFNDNISLNGNLNISAGSVSASARTITMNGSGKTFASNSQTFGGLTVAGNTTLAGSLNLAGNLTINNGITLDTSSSNYAVSVGGNWANSGTYTGHNSPVTLSGSGDQVISGSNSFYQLTATAPSTSRTLSFANGTTQTISNALTFAGSEGFFLSLRSDVTDQSWSITPNGTRSVSYVDVKDSNNTIISNPIIASGSRDSGNNNYWTINAPPITVSAEAVTSIRATSATLNGTISEAGNAVAHERGFYLYLGSNCSDTAIQNPKDSGGSYSTGSFSKEATGLSPITQYSYKSYATSSSESDVSSCVSFTTVGDIYYIVSGTSAWVRGSISATKDIAQQYNLYTTNNQNLNFDNGYVINSSTANTVVAYQTGIVMSAGSGDDSTPINTLNSGYIMANHGLSSAVVTSTGHNKDSTDIGSTWTDGTYQYILASISGSAITFYSLPYGSPWSTRYSVLGTLSHVSGASHTNSITVTSQTSTQKYPVVKNVVRQVLVNGSTDVITGGEGYATYVDLVEEFDLVDPSTIVTTNNPFVWNDGSVWMHVKNVLRATAGTTVIHSTYSIQRPMNIGYFGVIQVGGIEAPEYDHQYYYIPKTKPILSYDFKSRQILDTPPSGLVGFTQSYVDDVNNPPNREIIFLKRNEDTKYDIGFAFGYSPYGNTAAAYRDCFDYQNGCWWLYTSKKTYPVALGTVGEVDDTTYEFWAYRQYMDPTQYDVDKNVYWHTQQNGKDLVYIDYHTSTTNDTINLPSSYANKVITIIESSGIAVGQTTVPSNSQITVSTTGGVSYGYAVLELSSPSSSNTETFTPFGVMSGGGIVQSPLSASINSLLLQIAQLKAKIAAILGNTTDTTTPITTYIFTRNLSLGDTGEDVKALQQYLNTHGFPVATQGPGSKGNETQMFGYATRQALIKFQEAHADQILKPYYTKGTGMFGPLTRKWVNANP